MTVDIRQVLTRGPLYFIVAFICIFWSVPTLGVLISSFRSEREINESGWWSVFRLERDNPAYTNLLKDVRDRERALARAQERQQEETVAFESAQTTLETARASNDATQIAQAEEALAEAEEDLASTEARLERLQGRLEEARTALVSSGEPEKIRFGSAAWRAQWTIENYKAVLTTANMNIAFFNSLLVTIPSVVIPITIAAFAAYAFAWMKFPLRNVLFALVVVLMVVPLHVSLIPMLRLYLKLELNGTYLGIWLAHTGFGMPLAIYLLFGYISTIPSEIIESAEVDGASPFTKFSRLVLPLSVPAIASFAIFQFLWVWNDLLVALVFLGTQIENRVVTRELAEMVGSRGQDWEVLTAGAFISMILPLFIFFALQRYFIRGMMAGSVKG
ncbi:MAG: carbohydrate ABC transporter permease [Trueperaceae bacterium]|nr:MAG: carbohydrate ABC transporter permease [Trueperaceae bacterium]